MAESYDVIIIGSGPGGYVAAMRAAQLGLKTAIVEREHLGGICLNWGCIPTKALLRSAEIMHYSDHVKDYGLKLDGKVSADIAAVVDRSRGVSLRLNNGVGFLMKKNKVDVIWGEAKLTKPGEIVVAKTAKKAMEPQPPVPKSVKGEGTYTAKHIIVATGARPRVLPGIEPDGKLIWTYFEAMVPKEMPKSLLVMGSGAIGIEFASLLPLDGRRGDGRRAAAGDHAGRGCRDRRRFAQKQFEKHGMKIIPEAKVTKVEKGANSRHRACRDEGRQGREDHGGPDDLGRRRAGQHRESRSRDARREDRARLRRRRRLRQDQRARHLGHRRCRRSADARPQGRA